MRKGQVAIIVLLVSAVVMTVGLSLSKKATTETKIDTNEELLKKAFNAAESGIDYYLTTGGINYMAPDSLSSADVVVKDIGANNSDLDFGEFTPENGSEYYWLVNHLDDGSLGTEFYNNSVVNVCGRDFTGALEINYFYKTGSVFGVQREGVNFGNTNVVNGFSSISGSCVPINITSSPILITVTPLFGGGRFYLNGDGTFPVQGIEIDSTGKSGGVSAEVSGAKVNKRLKVSRRYKIPSFLLNAVVSETSVLSD